jgi:hypothetical protein
VDALDGGYRLAFLVALISVLIAIVLGVILIRQPTTSPVEDEAFEAESEAMIAEIM